MEQQADIEGEYRYVLTRKWSEKAFVNFVMLNPSTADAVEDDSTISRCVTRAQKLGYGGLIVTNLFALRNRDPKVLYTHADPIGKRNDEAILNAARRSRLVVCAWGTHGRLMNRQASVVNALRRHGLELSVLKLNADQTPAHPLYLPYALAPVTWKVRRVPWSKR